MWLFGVGGWGLVGDVHFDLHGGWWKALVGEYSLERGWVVILWVVVVRGMLV